MTRTEPEGGSDDPQAKDIRLGPSAFVVLGLIARIGPSTPYELRRAVLKSVAFFWDFPQSQLYVEPPRLARAGLLHEEREEHGRRRRVFSLTDRGRLVLKEWLESSSEEPTEVRDVGLLKLSFGGLLGHDLLIEHAREQLELHKRRLAAHEQTHEELSRHEHLRPHQVTVGMGERFEQAFIEYWQSILDDPPATDPGVSTL